MIYEAECEGCGLPFDYAASVKDYQIVPPCPACAAPARKVIRTAPVGVVTGKFEPFKSMVDGTMITNQRDLKEHNLRNRVVNLNDGYSEEKIISGELVQKPKQDNKKDVVQDVVQSIKAVEGGYKPKVEVQDD